VESKEERLFLGGESGNSFGGKEYFRLPGMGLSESWGKYRGAWKGRFVDKSEDITTHNIQTYK